MPHEHGTIWGSVCASYRKTASAPLRGLRSDWQQAGKKRQRNGAQACEPVFPVACVVASSFVGSVAPGEPSAACREAHCRPGLSLRELSDGAVFDHILNTVGRASS